MDKNNDIFIKELYIYGECCGTFQPKTSSYVLNSTVTFTQAGSYICDVKNNEKYCISGSIINDNHGNVVGHIRTIVNPDYNSITFPDNSVLYIRDSKVGRFDSQNGFFTINGKHTFRYRANEFINLETSSQYYIAKDLRIFNKLGDYVGYIMPCYQYKNHIMTYCQDDSTAKEDHYFEKTYTPQEILDSAMNKTTEYSGVYVLHNIDKDMNYVGQAARIIQRLKQHLTGRGGNPDVYFDFRSGDNFEIGIFPIKDSPYNTLDAMESDYIDKYEANTKGYNKTAGNYSD